MCFRTWLVGRARSRSCAHILHDHLHTVPRSETETLEKVRPSESQFFETKPLENMMKRGMLMVKAK